MEFEDEIREFLIESGENLAMLDQDFVQLERTPENAELISNVFRTVHTIKGTCGFFDLHILGAVAHLTENLLSQVREKKRVLTPELVSLLLEAVDTIKNLLNRIEQNGSEGQDDTKVLQERLRAAHADEGVSATPQGREPALLPEPKLVSGASSLAGGEPATQAPAPAAKPIPATTVNSAADTPKPPAVTAADSEKNTGASMADELRLAETTIRVDVGLLNRLMNLVGELVLARNQLLQETSQLGSGLQQTSQRLNLITSELQESVMKTRMQPIGVVWNKLPRIVRDLAAKCGKSIHIEMEGAGTELDKTIIEAIKDPLTHIVRNCCDHGIETSGVRLAAGKKAEGKLLLRAYHEGGVVNIEITDDGAGINLERVKSRAVERGLIRPDQAQLMGAREVTDLIFLPGFSTAAQVTSISGRGVGMDVVKTNIEKIGGTVEVLPCHGGGTTLRIKIPLTLAIIPGLIVTLNSHVDRGQHGASSQQERFIIPQANLLELVRLEGDDVAKRIEKIHGTTVFHHRGKLLPLVYLHDVLKRADRGPATSGAEVKIVVLQAEHRQLGLVVDQICDTQEIVVKPLGRQLKQLSCYVGATIMGDGHPALILDAAGLYQLAGLAVHSRQAAATTVTVSETEKQQMILLFRAGPYSRLAVSLSAVDRIEEIAVERIEYAGGRPVLNYREDILPLVSLDDQPLHSPDCSTIQVVVFTNGPRRVGLIVEQILDIVTEHISVRRGANAYGLLGSAILGGHLTDLLDLHTVVQSAGENWLEEPPAEASTRQRLMLLDASATPREMLSDYLASRGYDVLQVGSAADAKARLRQLEPHALLVSSGCPLDEKRDLNRFLQADLNLSSLPVLELQAERHWGACSSAFASEGISRSEREGLVAKVTALIGNTAATREVVQ